MKKIFLIVVMIFLVFSVTSCSNEEIKRFTAEELVIKMQEAGLPIDNVIVYTEETDHNKLLGRPNQYISKVNFADTRVDQFDPENPKGGTIETFNNVEDVNNRKEYIESVTASMSALTQYIIINDIYLLRIDGDLTPTQAKEYEEMFVKF